MSKIENICGRVRSTLYSVGFVDMTQTTFISALAALIWPGLTCVALQSWASSSLLLQGVWNFCLCAKRERARVGDSRRRHKWDEGGGQRTLQRISSAPATRPRSQAAVAVQQQGVGAGGGTGQSTRRAARPPNQRLRVLEEGPALFPAGRNGPQQTSPQHGKSSPSITDGPGSPKEVGLSRESVPVLIKEVLRLAG